jgi:hypothetical protein
MMSDQDEPRMNKEQLLERIHTSYAALEKMVSRLSDTQLIQPDDAGWTVKDHLAHIAAWELGMAEHLAGGDRFAAMQIDHPRGRPIDEVNDVIYRQNAHLTTAEALDMLSAAHRRFLEVLETLSDDDLYRPYRSFLPEGERGPSDPVMNWIAGNTFGHFEEHTEWLEKYST